MKKVINSKMSFRRMFRIEELRGFSNYVIGFKRGLIRFLMSFMNIETVYNRSKTRDTGDIVNGLNRVIEIKQQGYEMEYNIYSEQEIKKNRLKKDVKIVHFPVGEKQPFALVIAGGAYQAVSSASESFPTCSQLNEMGYHAFALNYRVGDMNPFPIQVEDLHQAIKYILSHAEELNVDRKDYAVMGFSAGGHLTGTLLLDEYILDEVPYPKCIGPHYPALFYKDKNINSHGKDETSLMKIINDNLSYIEKHLLPIPPKVCWYHCLDDQVLPAEGSAKLDALLTKKNYPHLYLEYPYGGHGAGLGTSTSAKEWLNEFVTYWQA